MLNVVLITYSIAAIITAGRTFCSLCEEARDVDLWWLAIIFSSLYGVIVPIIVVILAIISLLPIIIMCATAIYIFG